ncbi:glycosyltransferase family 2 protein [Streptomyces sp. LP05-1]|uniref:4,4'-diaponeurosporenoate glycosyltransferase n=1 Tax=Streptomyces pyxinae TaxID=2970734 RepID=A0ABT2CHJ8_9ACTN|nr:glycosyltransferase family 2 protein [Streptomyces sp. LP05-1]MCS0636892.1 glycosyltransferase family 2 protein [Streptomyces sp. LP05-1]
MIPEAVAVVVPAHDEEALLPAALAALATAAAHPELAGIPVRTVVVADACRDRTAALAREAGALVLVTDCRNPGRARAAGVRYALDRFAGEAAGDPGAVWLTTTDADSVVPSRWLAYQLARARDGWQAVVGTVVLPVASPLAEPHRALYEATRPADGTVWHHPHVHGANLGVRAAAYLDVGGFPPLATGEDRALVEALDRRGHRVLRTAGCPVLTSPRLRARARDGFGAYLSAMPDPAGA